MNPPDGPIYLFTGIYQNVRSETTEYNSSPESLYVVTPYHHFVAGCNYTIDIPSEAIHNMFQFFHGRIIFFEILHSLYYEVVSLNILSHIRHRLNKLTLSVLEPVWRPKIIKYSCFFATAKYDGTSDTGVLIFSICFSPLQPWIQIWIS